MPTPWVSGVGAPDIGEAIYYGSEGSVAPCRRGTSVARMGQDTGGATLMEMLYSTLVRAHTSPAIALAMTLLGLLGALIRSLAMVGIPRFGMPDRPR